MTGKRQGLALLTLAVAFALGRSSAGAEAPRLLLLQPEPALLHATEVALEPWGVEVRASSEAAPAPSLPASASRARAIATAHGASSLAWISDSPDGQALWLYEVADDRIVAQPVDQPAPYDAAEAAALALSLKALLRHSASAPATERYGASAMTEGEGEIAQRESESPPVGVSQVHEPLEPPRGLELAFAGGVRAFELTRGSAEPRLWLSLAWTMPVLGGSVGPMLVADLGFRGVRVERRGAQSTLRSQGVALGATGRWPVGQRVELGADGLLSLRLTHLSGRLDDVELDVRRANPCLTGRLHAGVWVGRARLFLQLGLEVPLRTQRYLVDGRTLLALSPAAGEAALGVAVALP